MKRVFSIALIMLAIVLAAGAVWAQTGSNMMDQQQQGQMPYGSGYGMMGPGYGGYGMMGRGYGGYGMMGRGYGGYGMMGPGMMGMGYGGGYGMMGPGMMGGGYGMMGPGMMGMGYGGGYGMMGMMMNHMMGGGYGMMGMGGMGMGYMLNYLDLSADQWKKVRALAAQRLEKMSDIVAKMSKMRFDLWSLSSQDKIDPAKVKKLFAQKAELHAEMFLSGKDYLQKIKAILNKDQLKRLRGWRY